MSKTSKGIAYALSLLLLIPAVAMVAAPRAGGPNISTPSISPSSPGPNDQVTVTVTVTSGGVGIQNVTTVYTTDNWKATNTTLLASYNSTNSQAAARIPALHNGGQVKYYIVAFDNSNNRVVNDNNGSYFSYTVPAPTSGFNTNTWIELAIVLIVVGAGASIAFYSFRRKTPSN